MEHPFQTLSLAPIDPILGVSQLFQKDTSKQKVNLTVGIFMNELGQVPVLKCVKEAEKILLSKETSKAYLPIQGNPTFLERLQKLHFGETNPAVTKKRITTFHTPAGVGALRLGAEFLKKIFKNPTILLSKPTWNNHNTLFANAGFSISLYPYRNPETQNIDFDQIIACLEQAEEETAVLLQAVCHNPTGIDFSENQWKELLRFFQKKQLIPFFDLAYQGFSKGIEQDVFPLRLFAESGIPFLAACSFSKNMGLYRERVGCLHLVCESEQQANIVKSQVSTLVRAFYSNPPSHGGAIVSEILGSQELTSLWEKELKSLREYLHQIREQIFNNLSTSDSNQDWSFIKNQAGMFTLLNISEENIEALQKEYSIYMIRSGRINVTGLNPKNIDYFCDAFSNIQN